MADSRTCALSFTETENLISQAQKLKFIKAISNYCPLLEDSNKVTDMEFSDLICTKCGWSYLTSQEMQIISALREYINNENC